MKRLTEKQKSYVAAIFDGEGCITINANSKNKAVGVTAFATVNVSNTNMVLLAYLHRITGIGRIAPGFKQEGHKQKYVWNIRVHEMKELLPQIQDDLVIKWDQCAIVLEFITRKWSNPLNEEDNSLRRIMIAEMAELNKRGD
jgi:hypothetical protein